VGNKTRQRVLVNLGRVDDLQNSGQIDRLIESLKNFSTKEWIRKEALNVNQTYLWGPVVIFEQLWKELGIERVLRRLLGDTDAVSDYVEAIFAMVLNRLVEPRSKRGVDKWVNKVYRPEFEQLSLHHYYRGLDYLEKFKEEVEEELFSNVKTLFNLNLDLVFWDTTSTYFQGEGPELSLYGRSKDHRSDCKQVVIGVLMTKDGFPVAHQIFPGNTADIDTFTIALEDIRRRFNIDRVIVVADRGMISARVKGHIMICFLALVMETALCRKLKEIGSTFSYAEILEDLKEIRAVELTVEGKRFLARTEMMGNAYDAFKSLKIRPPDLLKEIA